MKERIHKVLANAGVASRRGIEEMIRQGRVAVNGRVMTELPILIDAERDRVSVDGESIRLNRGAVGPRMYFLLNKPKGVYCTNVAQGAQKLAIDLLPPKLPGRVYPVGQLDADSKGLLILTNDGELTNRLTHPRYGVAKTYRVIADGYVEDQTVKELEKGVWLADEQGKGFKATADKIKFTHREPIRSILDITLGEGRSRQIQRMFAKFGHKVRDVTRIRLGPLTLADLPVGKFRTLTPKEIRQLQNTGEPSPAEPRKSPAKSRPRSRAATKSRTS